jgi:hypothetical protein
MIHAACKFLISWRVLLETPFSYNFLLTIPQGLDCLRFTVVIVIFLLLVFCSLFFSDITKWIPSETT